MEAGTSQQLPHINITTIIIISAQPLSILTASSSTPSIPSSQLSKLPMLIRSVWSDYALYQRGEPASKSMGSADFREGLSSWPRFSLWILARFDWTAEFHIKSLRGGLVQFVSAAAYLELQHSGDISGIVVSCTS